MERREFLNSGLNKFDEDKNKLTWVRKNMEE